MGVRKCDIEFDLLKISIHFTLNSLHDGCEKILQKWQDGEIEKLIDLYEENPCLWDIFDNSYQKRDVKERALAAIAKKLDIQNTDIKLKWTAIRGQFGREI